MSTDDCDDDQKYDLKWTEGDEKKAREILRLGQTYLSAQLQTALAADARATAMAALWVTLALALIAGGLGYWETEHKWALLGGAITTAVVLLCAAGRAAWAARPITFYLAGIQPRTWFNHIKDDLPTLMGGQAEIDDRDIRRNEKQLKRNGKAVMQAFRWAVGAPIWGLTVWAFIALVFE
jgi:hypothetical protein